MENPACVDSVIQGAKCYMLIFRRFHQIVKASDNIVSHTSKMTDADFQAIKKLFELCFKAQWNRHERKSLRGIFPSVHTKMQLAEIYHATNSLKQILCIPLVITYKILALRRIKN